MNFCLKQKKTLSTGGRNIAAPSFPYTGSLFYLCLLSGNLLFFMRHGKYHRRVGKHCACDVEEHQKSAPVQHSDADNSNPETDVGRRENTRANIMFFSSPFARRTISSSMAAEKNSVIQHSRNTSIFSAFFLHSLLFLSGTFPVTSEGSSPEEVRRKSRLHGFHTAWRTRLRFRRRWRKPESRRNSIRPDGAVLFSYPAYT